MPMRYQIEPIAGEEDLDGVLAVESESFTNPWTREMYESELRVGSRSHIVVVRTGDSPVAGFCSFWLVLDEIHINNLAIAPRHRRHGLGAALVRYVLAQAPALGATRATLEVRASNAPAIRLYERLGFRVEGTRRNYYTNPDEDALVLWWHGGE
jgi:ribosomal-protein-alanine N-acetyltransferase